MTNTDALWRQLEKALSHHRKVRLNERTGIDVFNRLFREHAKRDGLADIPVLNPSTCSIRLESWTVKQIGASVRAKHTRAEPMRLDGPLIMVERSEYRYLIDGNNRLNYWMASGDEVGRDVIVVGIPTSVAVLDR